MKLILVDRLRKGQCDGCYFQHLHKKYNITEDIHITVEDSCTSFKDIRGNSCDVFTDSEGRTIHHDTVWVEEVLNPKREE